MKSIVVYASVFLFPALIFSLDSQAGQTKKRKRTPELESSSTSTRLVLATPPEKVQKNSPEEVLKTTDASETPENKTLIAKGLDAYFDADQDENEERENEAFAFFKQASKNKSPLGHLWLGRMYSRMQGPARSIQDNDVRFHKMYRHFEEAIKLGLIAARQELAAYVFKYGDSVSRPDAVREARREDCWPKAFAILMPAVNQESIHAINSLGNLYKKAGMKSNDPGTQMDYFKKARKAYLKAIRGGSADAERNLGTLFEIGCGVPVNYSIAHEYYQKALNQGLEHATDDLERVAEKIKRTLPEEDFYLTFNSPTLQVKVEGEDLESTPASEKAENEPIDLTELKIIKRIDTRLVIQQDDKTIIFNVDGAPTERRPSRLVPGQNGLFAQKSIEKGTIITWYTGKIHSTLKTVNRVLTKGSDDPTTGYILDVGNGEKISYFIDAYFPDKKYGGDEMCNAGNINHSHKAPNAEFVIYDFKQIRGQFQKRAAIVAIQPIAADEEITLDYGLSFHKNLEERKKLRE